MNNNNTKDCRKKRRSFNNSNKYAFKNRKNNKNK